MMPALRTGAKCFLQVHSQLTLRPHVKHHGNADGSVNALATSFRCCNARALFFLTHRGFRFCDRGNRRTLAFYLSLTQLGAF